MDKTFLRRHALLLAVLASGAAFSLSILILQQHQARSAEARIWFFDVGQGDSALIRDRDGHDLLIDGGPDDSLLEGLSEALPWNDRMIDTLLVTHLDADHYAGFFAVLRRYRIGEIWWSGVVPTTATARRFVQEVERLGIPQHFAKAGDVVDFQGASFTVLWPREQMSGRIVQTTNDAGVVGRFDCGQERALFTADVSAQVEARLIDDPASIRSELLKVPHHGSAYSSSGPFLDAVRPREAVISVGAGNRYGHPAPRTLAALLARGVALHRTDREGTIRYACRHGSLRLAK